MSRSEIVDKGGSGKEFIPKFKKGDRLKALDNTNYLELGGVYEALGNSNLANTEEQVLIRIKDCEKYVYVRRFELVKPEVNKGKKGDIVVCVDNSHTKLTLNREYILFKDKDESKNGWVIVNDEGIVSGYFGYRFKLKEQAKEEVKPETSEVIEAGDTVVCIESNGWPITVDKVYKVISVQILSSGIFYRVENDKGNTAGYCMDRFKLVSKGNKDTPLQAEVKPVNYKPDPAWDRLADMNMFRSSVPVQVSDGENSVSKRYAQYSKEQVDQMVKEGSLGPIGVGMWERTGGHINPDGIHPSRTALQALAERNKNCMVAQLNKSMAGMVPRDWGTWTDGIHPTKTLKWNLSEKDKESLNRCITTDVFDYLKRNPYPFGKWKEEDLNEIRNNLIKPKEEVKMSNRIVVSVKLIDQDKGLDVADSLVFDFGSIVTEDDKATTIHQLIMDYEVGSIVQQHNELRAEVDDLDILRRTGIAVKLRPIKLKDLYWSYTQI